MGKLTLRRRKKLAPPLIPPPPPLSAAVVKKNPLGARLWMTMDRLGQSELMECDKSVIINRVSIPPRDFRILGPIFSPSSTILAREKAMIVNLEFIRAIVTAEEILLLDPLCQEVLPFVDQLRRQLLYKSGSQNLAAGQWLSLTDPGEGFRDELPFEFQVLEIALEIVCTYLDTSVAELERDAYPALDELAVDVSTKNLEHVRSLKSNLTRLLARVQKVRDEIEHLLDDNQDMAQLYLTRKWIQNQQNETSSPELAVDVLTSTDHDLQELGSTRSGSSVSIHTYDDDVEDLEMLLEAYFTQLDGTRNKILSVREYIDDTEDYVNIQLDSQRNELIQLQLTITIISFAITFQTLCAAILGMNLPCVLYEMEGIYGRVVGIMTTACIVLFILVFGYARWKKLLGS